MSGHIALASLPVIAVSVTIGLAFIGYIVTYFNGLRLAQRQERLSRVNRQLSDFYGPLLALTTANERIFNAFVEKNARPGGKSIFQDATPPTEEELGEWRFWVTNVFLSNIQAMRDIVISHTDLLSEPEMPSVLLDLCAHVSGYEITTARWAQGNYDEHLSVVHFPSEEIGTYARQGFSKLKAEQAGLLGQRSK
ncbi:hypothetical protein [Actinoallomurus sp. CA-150999]|uniref:hypothetical protein n=1 Tax=Actinoallomurus sp. CA-150999 TaxID=3239887 RepID=UPI003D8C2D0C